MHNDRQSRRRLVSSRNTANSIRSGGNSLISASSGKGLVRVSGPIVIALSALSQEYGTGINFVVPHGLGTYPAIDNLVPLAILVAGLLLIPQVILFSRFAKVMPNAGSSYVWLTRSLGPTAGFAVAFMWFVGLCGAMGFVAYVSATFLGNTLSSLGLPAAWMHGRFGHLVFGICAIWLLAALHCTGVKRYGYFIYIVGALILVATIIIVATGFTTSSGLVVQKLESLTHVRALPRAPHPSPMAFFSAVALFTFAYGGLSGGASLGGEAADPSRSMPRGIVGGWALALVLYTVITYALFHAVPWWSAKSLIHGGYGYLLTVPSLVGFLTSAPIAIFLNLLISVVAIKTLAPQLLSASRFLYAWAEDGFISKRIQSTNAAHAPAAAIIVAASLGTLFLLDAVYSGWAIGVAVRSVSLMLTFAMLGAGILRVAYSSQQRAIRSFSLQLTEGWLVKAMAIAALVIGLPLMVLASYQSGKPWYLEPWLQLAIAIMVALQIGFWARKRHNRRSNADFLEHFLEVPVE